MSRIITITAVLLIFSALIGGMIAFAQTAVDPPTELYVRTVPDGAAVLVDGKLVGESDDLFDVEPGTRKIVVKLDGYEPSSKEVTVPASRIERVVLKLKKRTDAAKALAEKATFGPVIEQVLNNIIRRGGSRTAEMLDLDTQRRATMREFGKDDRQTHRWIREQKVDVVGPMGKGPPVLLLFDTAVVAIPNNQWQTITASQIVNNWALSQQEPDKISTLPTSPSDLEEKTCIFKTREGGLGVLQIVGASDNSQGVKIRYKMIKDKAEPAASLLWTCAMHPQIALPKPGKCPLCAMDLISHRRRHFVRLVVGKDRMTFEGKDAASWEELPGLLEKVPNREQTVLEIAFASDEVTLKEKKLAIAVASSWARQFGYEYTSDIGAHPLGSKGSSTQRVPRVKNKVLLPDSGNPRPVKTQPEVGATDVDPNLTEIRATFDRDMDTDQFSWCGGGPHFPKLNGDPKWIDRRTCVLPVKLEKGKAYRLAVNWGRFQNFQSVDGRPATPTALYFCTRGASPELVAKMTPPKVVELSIANGAKDVPPGRTKLAVTFDQAMGEGMSWCNGPDTPKLEPVEGSAWSDDKKTCGTYALLEPGRSYTIYLNAERFGNFMNELGVSLPPTTWKFTTAAAGGGRD